MCVGGMFESKIAPRLARLYRGARPNTVLQNTRELGIDLSRVPTVVLTRFHADPVGGLLTLRSQLEERDPTVLSVTHVDAGIVNIVTDANSHFKGQPVVPIIGGFQDLP